jgi:choline-sulfatase
MTFVRRGDILPRGGFMRLRLWVPILLLLAFPAVPSLAQKPAVVLISLDTFRADRMAGYGGDPAITPALNGLASRGTVFSVCFTPVPITLPAHATLLTGCDPSRTALHDNGRGALAKGLPDLAESFKAAGYETRAVIASVVLEGRYGLERGFSAYDDAVGPGLRRTAGEVTDRALAALKEAKGPIFLWVHYYDCHEEYDPPQPYLSRFPKSLYNGAAAYMDAEIGRLLKAVPQGAIVAVTADHGESLGEHGEETHGILLFQPTVKVPFVLAGPGIPAGQSANTPCSLADVAPTLAALAGLSLVGKPDGRNLAPALRAKPVTARAFPLETWLPYDEFRWFPLTGVTDGRYKWVRARNSRLYDTIADPKELVDRASKAPAQAASLKASLPPLPEKAAPSEDIDPSLRGLGYTLVPTEGGTLKGLPDPHERVTVLRTFDEARRLRGQGHMDKALALFSKASLDDKGNPTVWFEMGETLRREGKLDDAARALDKAIAISPRMAVGWTSRGHIWLAQQKPDRAAACYEKALRVNPNLIEALNPMAARYLDLGQPEKAVPMLDRAISQGFADADTYVMKGRLLLQKNQRDPAKKSFDQAMALSAAPERTLKAIADIYTVHNLPSEGARLYEEGIRRFPDFAPNYLTYGNLLMQGEKLDRALALFKKALTLKLSAEDRKNVGEIVADLEGAMGGAGK